MTNITVATEILKQLGAKRFIAMVGAKDLIAGENSLQFGIGGGAKEGINKVKITLTDDDTYRVQFYKINMRKVSVTEISCFTGVYCDQLQSIFTEQTGFYTKL